MSLNREEVLTRLNAPNRLECLAELMSTEPHPACGQDVNNHIHTIYSFSPYSPTAAVWFARQAGLCTCGLMDHDSISGAEEFLKAAQIAGIAATIGVECRVSFANTPFAGRHLNNQDQASLAYIALHGIPHNRVDEVSAFFAPRREMRNHRNREMVLALNNLMRSFDITIDFDRDVLLTINGMYINTDKPDELCDAINEMLENDGVRGDFFIQNIAEDREQMRRIMLMISIFLYGFIIVTTLIGVTNIFNTIYTNMNLRAREFAMLKSVGMTGREFNRMVRLESIMYGSKSLAIGLPLGVILSYVIYKTISKEIELGYNIPVAALLISVIFVMIIVWMTMHFSLSRIKRQNIIETIRKQTY